jgi:hypothetical protein
MDAVTIALPSAFGGATLVASISRTLLNSMADWQLFFGCVGLVLIASLVGLFVTRRYLDSLRTDGDAGVVAGVTAIAMTLFAFVLAFGVVSLYDQFNNAEDSVSGEASDMAQIARDSMAFPAATRGQIDGAVKNYVLEVRRREFHLMRFGREDGRAEVLFDRIFTALQGYEPKTQSQVSFYGSAVDELNDAVIHRRERHAEMNAALPIAFSTLIILTAIVSIVTTFFVTTKSRALEFLLVGSVAIIVGAGLLTVLLLQYPFSGSVAISSQPYVEGILGCVVLGQHCSSLMSSP